MFIRFDRILCWLSGPNTTLLLYPGLGPAIKYRRSLIKCHQCCLKNILNQGPAAFRPHANASSAYIPLVEKGRPVLPGLLATDYLSKEVLGWAQLMSKYASELVDYVLTFLDRTYERCRTSYMEAVLEKQSYMLLGRSDVEGLMKVHPANVCFQSSRGQSFNRTGVSDAETVEVEMELSDLLLGLRPIKQENLIHDDNKLILLASLSDSLEYLADSIERIGESFGKPLNFADEKNQKNQAHNHTRSLSTPPKTFTSVADEYRKLAVDCLKVLQLEMELESIFHMQEMTNRDYSEDQDAEEPDDFVMSLTALIT